MIPGSLPGDGDRGPHGKGQADRSDVRQECVRVEKSPNRFSSSMDKRTGASPSCLTSVSRMPAFGAYPFDFAYVRRMRPLSVGRLRAPFI